MKKSKLAKGILTILMTVFTFLTPNVFAKGNSKQITLETSQTDLVAGDEITIRASLPDDAKAYALIATLKYDENVFEKIADEDFSSDNSVDVTYNAQNNKFGVINQSGEITDNLFAIRLRVKEDTNVGDTNVALTNITASYGEGKITYPVSTLKMNVTRDAKEGEAIPNYTENKIFADEEHKTTTTLAMKPIIYTTIGLFVVLVAITIIFKIKYPKKKKNFYCFLILDVIALLLVVLLSSASYRRNDVNKDGEHTYNDAKEIIEYLINIDSVKESDNTPSEDHKDSENKESSKQDQTDTLDNPSNNDSESNTEESNSHTVDFLDSSTNKPSKPDTNGDGNVDIDDAGHTVHDVNKQSKVELSEISNENIYFANGSEVILRFRADITPTDLYITKVKIDNKYYDAILDDGVYSVNLGTNDIAGKLEIEITNVILSNRQEIPFKYKFKREVLKSAPYINKLDLDDENGTLTFELVDKDEAFIEGNINVYDKSGKSIKSEKLQKVNKITDIPVKEDEKYILEVVGSYNLDSNENDDKHHYNNEKMLEHDFVIGGDYDFVLNDIGITDEVHPGEKPVLTFKSTNVKKANVEFAKIKNDNGEELEYNVTQNNEDSYEIDLINASVTPGKHTITLNSITLDTLKMFQNGDDYKSNKLTYTVLKESPRIKDLKISDNSADKEIKTTFKVVDADQTIASLNVALVDSTGKFVSQEKLSKDNLKDKDTISLNLSYDGNTDGFYTVKVLGNYALSDQYVYTNKSLGEEEILTRSDNDIYIKDIYITNNNNANLGNEGLYPTKGQSNYQIAFELEVSDAIAKFQSGNRQGQAIYQGAYGITINGLNYIASPVSGWKSKAVVTVPSDAGILKLKATRVQLANNRSNNQREAFYSVTPKEITIDVLKDAPTIKNLIITDDYEKGSATFNFDVVEDKTAKKDEFTNGTIELNNETQEIHVGNNKVTFDNIPKDTNLDLVFKGSYDLDTNTLNDITGDKNAIQNGELLKVKYGLYPKNIYQNINITDGKVISKNDNQYFKKNEDIKLSFNVSGIDEKLETSASKVIIDNKEYPLTKFEDHYELILKGYTNSGKKEIVISDVILDNGKKVTLDESYKFNLEVLKDKIKISDYKYEDLEDKLKITIKLKDSDKSLIGDAHLLITDENKRELYNDVYKENIEIPKEEGILRYTIQLTASYDLDIDSKQNSDNYHENVILLDELISLDKNNIELKKITDIELYKTEQDRSIEVIETTAEEINQNVKAYFALIHMENTPSVYARIKKAIEENNWLILIVDGEYLTQNGDKTNELRINFGELKDGKYRNETNPIREFERLVEQVKNNEDITLTHDYDFRKINVEDISYFDTYSGTIDGNNHKIYNLDKQLFKTLTNTTIKNLTLENAKISGNVRGILANTATNIKIDNVHIYNSDIAANNSIDGTGIMFGDTRTSAEIKNSSIVNSNVSGGKRTGGFIGFAYDKTVISNCYISNSSVSGNLDAIGGIVGEVNQANNVSFSNCYSNVIMNNGNGTAKAGILGYTNNANNTKFNNILSLADGTNGKRVHGNGINATNVYELEESKMTSNADNNIKTIKKDAITSDFFKDTLHFDSSIWELENISYSNLPVLKGEDFTVKNEFIENTNYDASKENLYKNLQKLMPYYDNNKIIQSANGITDELLIKDTISHIVPIGDNGKIVTYLTTSNLKEITKLKIVFKSGQSKEYSVTFDKTYDMVATYRINDLNIDYNYKHYIINSDSQVVNNLTNYLKSLDYTNNLDILTTNADNRIFKDFYNETTSKELKEFVLKFLSNSDYTNTTNDEAINSYLEGEVKKDHKIEKALYAYNYFRRFYDVDIDGMKVYDFVLFNMQGFDESLTFDRIVSLYFADPSGASFNSNETSTKYTNLLSSYTKLKRIPDFLEYLVTKLSNHSIEEWTRSQFKGILAELPVDGHPEIQYSLWDHFSNADTRRGENYRVYNFVLPILTLPETAAYIISGPTQFLIGAQRVYMKDPTNPEEVAAFKERLETYTRRMKAYYTTAYSILGDKKLFNDLHVFQIDKRYTKNPDGTTTFNISNATNEPYHKNFSDVVGLWGTADGNNAGANGELVMWQAAGILDSTLATDGTFDVGHVTFKTWSHESAHNIDARLFFRNNGRRWDAGGEDYADNFLMQSFSENEITMNLSINFNSNLHAGSNLTPERINSPEKIKDFYGKVFDTIYMMDYLEGRAFLQLTPELQSKLAVQISYPDEDTYINDAEKKHLAYKRTKYKEITKEDFENMHLAKVSDLYDNKLMLAPGLYKESTRGDNSYGGEGFNTVHWYQPHNDYGRPDSYSLKWLSYEFLGYAGYDNGFLEFASNIHPDEKGKKTDLMALQRITNGQYDSFDAYKKARFQKVEDNLSNINSMINVKEYVQKFYDALVKDAAEMEAAVQKQINSMGSEEKCLNDYWCVRGIASAKGFPNSTEVRKEIYYKLKDASDDFRSDIIYTTDANQDVADLTVTKN